MIRRTLLTLAVFSFSIAIAGCGAARAPMKAPVAAVKSDPLPALPMLTASGPIDNPYAHPEGAPSSGAAGTSTTSSPRPSAAQGNALGEELKTNTERVGADPRKEACGGTFGKDAKCGRIRVSVGPMVVTNAYASGGCPDELFLMAGKPEKPHWILLNRATAAMNVSGQFTLEDGEELFAGVRATAGTPKDDVKCGITWSGFRPALSSAR